MVYNQCDNSLSTYKHDYGIPVMFKAGDEQGWAVNEKVVFEFVVNEKTDEKLIKGYVVDSANFQFGFKLTKAEAERLAATNKRVFSYTVKRLSPTGKYLQTLFNSTLTINSTIKYDEDGEQDG